MTKLEHTLELVFDIRDCSKRSRELGFADRSEALGRIADDIEHWAREERPSSPHILAGNKEARATASKHFQEARRLLRGINK